MPQITTRYVCQSCGAFFRQWLGKCSTCEEWGSLQEENAPANFSKLKISRVPSDSKPVRVSEISMEEMARTSSGIQELDRVLGGGILPGSLVLVGGEPGIGKSTLLLQMAGSYSREKGKALYVSAEESLTQLKHRAQRVGIASENLFLLAQSDVSRVETFISELSPSLLVIDSIQMVFHPELESEPGSLIQVRGSAARFMEIAKKTSIPIFLVGHVTKDGTIAGPRILEHLVDTVLYFEGEKWMSYRVLRSVKNRFGTVDEVGIFKMEETGLEEVKHPSEIFLEEKRSGMSGSVIVSSLEGTRPLFLEIQALVSNTKQGFPVRRSSGIDLNRMGLLLAVLEKRAKIRLEGCDVFVNVAGGMKIVEPAADLGVAMAIVSATSNIPVHDKTVFVGEVGLGGEIRTTRGLSRRISEARNLGFQVCVIPETREKLDTHGIEILAVKTILDVVERFFKG